MTGGRSHQRSTSLEPSDAQQRIAAVKQRISVTTDPMDRLAVAFDLLRSVLARRFGESRTDARALRVVTRGVEILVQLAERAAGASRE